MLQSKAREQFGGGGTPMDRIQVESVEKFQGREKKVIIVSTVRARDTATKNAADGTTTAARVFGIGHLDCPKRTNVSLSRAVERQIIVGDAQLLGTNSVWWRQVVEFHNKHNAIVSLASGLHL
jgi:superfamily I DNA and/or RNA helicase